MKKHWIKKCCMILTCLYLTGCGREEVPYLDTTQTQEQTVETERTEQKETLKSTVEGLTDEEASYLQEKYTEAIEES